MNASSIVVPAPSVLKLSWAQLRRIVHTLGCWWLAEFLALLPITLSNFLTDTCRRQLVISHDGETVSYDLRDGAGRTLASDRLPQGQFSLTAIEQFLKSRGLAVTEVYLGLRLPVGMIFRRTMTLPLEAAGAVETIALEDLRRRTPFKLDEIYHEHLAASSGDGRLSIGQWVTRRDFVAQSAAHLDVDPSAIAFVESDTEGESPHRAHIELKPRARSGSWIRRAATVLCVSAVALAVAAAGLRYHSQQVALESFDARIRAVKERAQKVRAVLDAAEQKQNALMQLRSRRQSPGLVDILEETTHILPTHSWLVELRLSDVPDKRERRLALVGYSAEAPSLVSILNASPKFAEASLTAPISVDNVENRERFSLQATILIPEPVKELAK